MWAGCLLALCGSIALGSSHTDGSGDIGSGLATGDMLLVGAAIMWSIETVRVGYGCSQPANPCIYVLAASLQRLSNPNYTPQVRIEKHLRRLPGLELSSYELATMAALSAAWLGADAGQALSRGDSLDTLWQGYGSVLNWAILLWPAVGPWGIGKGIQVCPI